MLTLVPSFAWVRDRSSAVADVGEPSSLSPHAIPAVTPCWGLDLEQERRGDEPSSFCGAEVAPDAILRLRDALRRAR